LHSACSPHVVHEEIEPAVVRTNACEERLDVRIDRVIAADRDPAAAARGHFRRGAIDGAWNVVGGGSRTNASTGDIDDRAGRSELQRDATTGAAACTRDESHRRVQ
jgi:hypothetical protein